LGVDQRVLDAYVTEHLYQVKDVFGFVILYSGRCSMKKERMDLDSSSCFSAY